MSTLTRLAALEAQVSAQAAEILALEELLSQPPVLTEVARAEASAAVWPSSTATLLSIPGLFMEVDTGDYSVQLDFYIAHLSALANVGSNIGLSITVDGVSYANTTLTVPIAAAFSFGPIPISCRIPEGSGTIEVEGQALIAGGGTLYVADDSTTTSYIRALRL